MTGEDLYEELKGMTKKERQGSVLFRDDDSCSTEIEIVILDAGDIVLKSD